MNAPHPLPRGAGSPNKQPAQLSPRCPDCGAGDLSYRIRDEDTGCFYPVDDGEHFCRHCDCVWTDEDVLHRQVLRDWKVAL